MSKLVSRAWLVDEFFDRKTVKRVLVDDYGMVFYPGDAWKSTIPEGSRLVFLPGGPIPYNDWWMGWWESNWKECPDWVWCYGMYKSGEVKV
jgi:hypothetical protein